MGNQLTRNQKVNRAYALGIAGTGSAVVAIVMLFVAGFGLFLLFAIVAALCFFGFRRTVN